MTTAGHAAYWGKASDKPVTCKSQALRMADTFRGPMGPSCGFVRAQLGRPAEHPDSEFGAVEVEHKDVVVASSLFGCSVVPIP